MDSNIRLLEDKFGFNTSYVIMFFYVIVGIPMSLHTNCYPEGERGEKNEPLM